MVLGLASDAGNSSSRRSSISSRKGTARVHVQPATRSATPTTLSGAGRQEPYLSIEPGMRPTRRLASAVFRGNFGVLRPAGTRASAARNTRVSGLLACWANDSADGMLTFVSTPLNPGPCSGWAVPRTRRIHAVATAVGPPGRPPPAAAMRATLSAARRDRVVACVRLRGRSRDPAPKNSLSRRDAHV